MSRRPASDNLTPCALLPICHAPVRVTHGFPSPGAPCCCTRLTCPLSLLETRPLPAYLERGNVRLDQKEYPQAVGDYTMALQLQANLLQVGWKGAGWGEGGV